MTGRSAEAVRRLEEEIERTRGPVSRRQVNEIVSPNARVTDPKEQQRIKLGRLQTALDIETGARRAPPMRQEQPERAIRGFPRPGGQRMRWNSEERSYEPVVGVVEDNGRHDGFIWS